MSGTQLAERPQDDRLSIQLASDWGAQNITCHLSAWQDPQTFLGLALSVFAHKDYGRYPMGEKLRAVQQFALLGLYPGPENHAYVIPRGQQLDVMPGYKGFLFLAQQQAGVKSITAHLVHQSDTIEVENVGPDKFSVAEHRYDPLGKRIFLHHKKAGSTEPEKTGLRGGYCRKEMEDGSVSYHFIPAHRIHANLSAAQTSKVAERWPERMYRKTVVRASESDGFFEGDVQINLAMKRLKDADNDAMGNDPRRGGYAGDEEVVSTDAKSRVLRALQPPATETEPQKDFDVNEFWGSVSEVSQMEHIVEDAVARAALAVVNLDDPADLDKDTWKVVEKAIIRHLSGVQSLEF